ncbi:MAG: MarR family transcriptional regulator [Maledivibacter sp.]|jgi:DNA-binding MarR family transcriptional regulator|nr:MarR family transcriptional regulator [Maledivibacter sp.]
MVNGSMKKYSKTIEFLLRVNNKLNLISKEPRDFGTGDFLYSTEIHTIVAISKTPGTNLTQLAETLGVSKSAASKFIKKLIAKHYIIKSRPVDNQREVIFNLTDKGKIAFQGHERFSSETFKRVYSILEDSKEREIVTIENFLEKLNEELAQIIEKI